MRIRLHTSTVVLSFGLLVTAFYSSCLAETESVAAPATVADAVANWREGLKILAREEFDFVDERRFLGKHNVPALETKRTGHALKIDDAWSAQVVETEKLPPSKRNANDETKMQMASVDGEYLISFVPPGDKKPIILRHSQKNDPKIFYGVCGAVHAAEAGYFILDSTDASRSYIDDIASSQDVSISNDNWNGKPVLTIHARTRYGEYAACLDPARKFLPVHVKLTKKVDDIFQAGKLKDFIPSDARKTFKPVFGQSYELTFDITASSAIAGSSVMTEGTLIEEVLFSDGTIRRTENTFKRIGTSVGSQVTAKTPTMSLPDDTRIVDSDEQAKGPPMAWKSGRLVPYADQESIMKIDSALQSQHK